MRSRADRVTMGEIDFTASSRYTLGIEIELQILDRITLDLAPLAPVLIAAAPPILQPRLSKELIQSILEVSTGICFSLDDVEYDLQQTCSLAAELAVEHQCLLHAASLHPSSQPEDQALTDDSRYLAIMEELQVVGRQFISQGFHVHVGLPDGDTAVRVMSEIQAYLPLLLALSSSSPFFRGSDTGFNSYRTKLFEMLPLAGMYTRFSGWQNYCAEIDMLIDSEVIDSYRDLWWDARLNPEFGTVEIRICDLPGRMSDILGLVACIQSLVATLVERKKHCRENTYFLLQANKWQASRHGLQGMFIDHGCLLGGGRHTMIEAVEMLLKKIEPMSIRLGCEDRLRYVERLLCEGSSADRQRRIFFESGEMAEVISTLHGEFWL